jgi:hypothetical protein
LENALQPEWYPPANSRRSFGLTVSSRFAGLQLLTKLVGRVNTGPKELVLDALLPFKEIFLLLAKSMLRDSEAQITALSSELVSSMAWWP